MTLVNLLNRLDYTNYKVDIMLLKRGSNELISFLPKSVNILYLEDYVDIPKKCGVLYRIKKNICIKSILKKYSGKLNLEYDYAISFNGFNNYADLISVSVKAPKRIIWVHNDFYSMVNHSSKKLLYKIMYKLMGKKFAYFDRIAIVCDEVSRTFNLFYKDKYKNKTFVVNNVIDDNEIREKSKEKIDISLDNNSFNIVSIGRLCKAKNFKKLIDVHSKLINCGFKVKTYIFGNGESYNFLKEYIEKCGVSDSMFLPGSYKNPYPILGKADLFVGTSLYESFGNAMIESLILGVPVVASFTAGSDNIEKNIAEKGSICVCKDTFSMYNAIVDIINNNKKVKPLDLTEYNKKVMKSFYDLLS